MDSPMPVGIFRRAALAFVLALLLFHSRAIAADRPDTTNLSSAPAMRAIGVSPPFPGAHLGVGPSPLDFGGVTVGETSTRLLHLSNVGDQAFTVQSLTISNSRFTSSFVGPLLLAPGASHSTPVTYQPGLPGLDTGTLSVHSDAVEGTVAIAISGRGVTVPDLGDGHVLIAPRGEFPGDQFGNAVSGAGDLNGDGFDDVIIAAWASDATGGDAGRAYIYWGGSPPSALPAHVLQDGFTLDTYGTSVAGLGDVNGDGYPDVAVGNYGSDATALNAGSAFVYFGGPFMNSSQDLTLRGEPIVSGRFGVSVAGAGDVNGDGFGDIVVGASGVDRAYVYYGGPGIDSTPDLILSGAPPEMFGFSVAGAGDMNGDGFADVIVGAPGVGGGSFSGGRAYVYLGGTLPDATADRIFTGTETGGRLGIRLSSAGDVNGDGYADVIVGADFTTESTPDATRGIGRAYVFFGGATLDAIADLTFTGDGTRSSLGNYVSSAGDVNGDGYSDLLVSALLHDAGGPDAGRAYVLIGGPGADATADFVFTGEQAGDRFGVSVASAGDVDGDGRDEIIVGAYFNDATAGEAGRAYVISMTDPSAPVVTAPESITGTSGSLITFQVFVQDPENVLISSLTAAPLPAGSMFDVTPDKTSGTFSWTPGPLQTGTYAITFTAMGGAGGSGSAFTTIVVAPGNQPPTLTAPASVIAGEGVPITFQIQASDPDGDPVTLGVQNRPVGSLFVDNGNNTGSFSWTPTFHDAGTFTVTFTGRDARGANAVPKPVSITVDDVNRAPVASPGGPYAGVVNVAVQFLGAGSSDPDGNALTFQWMFGDGANGVGPTPAHAYAAGGTFTVVLTVSDGGLSGTASTTATIQDLFVSRAFLEGGNRTTKLNSGKSATCVQVEPVNDSYANSSIVPSSVVMISIGTGSVDEISTDASKAVFGVDRDHNGIDEITACFRKEDLRLLFSDLTGGRHLVGVTIEGDLASGGRFRASLEMEVVASGGGQTASVSPNPLNPTGTLTFHTARSGPVSISVFDPSGRMVRAVRRDSFVPAGYHDVTLDGIGEDGVRLASGVYFYRVESVEGITGGRFVVMK
jgi:PKD repeat protein